MSSGVDEWKYVTSYQGKGSRKNSRDTDVISIQISELSLIFTSFTMLNLRLL